MSQLVPSPYQAKWEIMLNETLSVRFCEHTRYDIEKDCDVLMLMGITGTGTFHTEVDASVPSVVRIKREAFKQHVLSAMSIGEPPGVVYLE